MSIIVTRLTPPSVVVRFESYRDLTYATLVRSSTMPMVANPAITDGAQIEGYDLRFVGAISDNPILIPVGNVGAANVLLDLIGAGLCTVATPEGVFSNMVANVTERKNLGSVLEATFHFKSRPLASVGTILIPPRTPNPAAEVQVVDAADAGSQAGSAATAAQSSAAATLLDLVTGG